MAGMTLALALKSGGLDVALIERQPFTEQLDTGFDGRASAIAYACFRQWKVLGVGDALEASACRMDEIMVTDGHLPGPASRKPLPFFLNFKAEEISDRMAVLIAGRLAQVATPADMRSGPASEDVTAFLAD